MDDNTTKVVLVSIVFAFVVALMRRCDRVSLRIERLKIDIFGWLKVSTSLLDIAMQRRQLRPKQRRLNHSGDVAWPAPFVQGNFALSNTLRVVLGNHDIDMIVITHPDDDHLNGLRHFFQCPHHGSR